MCVSVLFRDGSAVGVSLQGGQDDDGPVLFDVLLRR